MTCHPVSLSLSLMEKRGKKNQEAIEAVQLRIHSLIHSVNSLNTCYMKGTVKGARDTSGDKKSWPLIAESLHSGGRERQ